MGTKPELIERINQKLTEKSKGNKGTIEGGKSDDEDGPIEDWTKSELVDECKTLGLDQSGTKPELLERIRQKWAEKSNKNKEKDVAKNSDNEDGPIEDWTKAELVDECKKLGLDQSGTKLELIERIQQKWAEKDNKNNEKEEAKNSSNEDGPIEDWTKVELVDECKTLGLDQSGTKPELIERIRQKWAEKDNRKKEKDEAKNSDNEGPIEDWT